MSHDNRQRSARNAASPGYRVVHLSDFDQASQFFPHFNGRFEQISRGVFQGRLQFVLGETTRIVQIDSNQQVVLKGDEASGLMGIYPVLAQNSASLWRGKRLQQGQVVVHGPGTHVNHLAARRSSSFGVSLDPEQFMETARVLLDSDGIVFPGSWSAATVNPTSFDRSNQIIHQWVNTAASHPGFMKTVECQRLEKEVLRSLITMLFPNVFNREMLTHSRRMQLVFRAEEIMRANLMSAIGSFELCKELGVSDRTLRLAFHERFGIGHMAFFKVLRLNAVRDLLKQLAHTSVQEAANALGFTHLGNFAADYSRHFGELPSETIKRCQQRHIN